MRMRIYLFCACIKGNNSIDEDLPSEGIPSRKSSGNKQSRQTDGTGGTGYHSVQESEEDGYAMGAM